MLFAFSSTAQEPKEKMYTWDKTKHSFGMLVEGEKVSTTFTLTNKGDKPISIISASSSCGCTIPSFAKDPIKSGAKSKIEVKFNSKGRSGAFSKSAIIKFSDGTHEILKITGEVYKKGVKK